MRANVLITTLATLTMLPPALGQETTGDLRGRVLDSEGHSVPYANVVVTGSSLQGQQGVIAGEDGAFLLLRIPAGVYTVTVSHISYRNVVLENVVLRPGETTPLGDIRLEEQAHKMPTIVVTAQRREEDRQKVPMTVTAVNETEIEQSAIRTTFDLQRRTPGLMVSHNVSMQPYIRGVGTDILGPGADPSVATYVDGVYQAGGALLDFFDVKRIEVLKGPQGTLYGRNTTGGTIHVISNPPVPNLGASVDLTMGDYGQARARGFVNVPIRHDDMFFRLSFLRSKDDGYMRNHYLGTDLADEDLWGTRAQLRVLAADDKLDVTLYHSLFQADHTRRVAWSIVPDQPSPGRDLGGTVSENQREVFHNKRNFNDTSMWETHAKVMWHLEGLTLTSVTAYRETKDDLMIDLDQTEVDYSFNGPAEADSKTFSQEVQIASHRTARHEWLAGAFFLHGTSFIALNINLPLAGIHSQPVGDNTTDAWGIFGQGSYFFAERLRGTAGLRYSYEKKHHVLTHTFNGALLGVADNRDSWDALTPRFGLEYHHGDDTMFYLTAVRGFKSGGFNSSQIQEGFDPEYIWAYEAGAKTSFIGDRLLAGFSGFFYDYEDIQIWQEDPVPGAFPQVVNAAQAEIKGVEAELFYRPSRRLSVGTGLVLLDTEYTEFISVDANNPHDDPDRSGNPLPRAPKFSASGTVEYEFPLGASGSLTLHSGYHHQSEIFFDPYKIPSVGQGSYGLWDASVRYDSPSRRWYLALYGVNLTDEFFVYNVLRNDVTAGTITLPGYPRALGVHVGIGF